MKQIIISKASKEDLEEILILQKLCYISEAELINDFSIPPLKQTLESIIDEYNQCVFIKAVSGNKIVGSVRGYKKDNVCYIGKVIVDPLFQNNGLGARLLNEIENIFIDCKTYELFTGFKSEKNLYFYNKYGYKEIKREKMNDKLTLVYLAKENNNNIRNL